MTKAGKISPSDFRSFFEGRLGHSRREVVTGPSFGVDVSVIDLGNGQAMTLTSDPLSLIPSLGLEESAWLSVHLMANDMATTGFAPMYGQFVLNLPVTLSEKDFQLYWKYIHKFCSDIKVSITGGHTGNIEGQNSTIAGGGTYITIAEKNKILTSDKASSGDSILMTKQCAISSAAILAMSFPGTVKTKLGNDVAQNGHELFYSTSSLKEALTIAKLNETDTIVSAMHDVTEGGVSGAVFEMAVASHNGVLLEYDKIPAGDTVREICHLFHLDPRNCIGAGAMLMTVKNGFEKTVIDALQKENIACSVIGTMIDHREGMNIVNTYGDLQPLLYSQKDPYWEAFFNALKNNWK